ncbi:hypothetical protein CI102_14849 [Trichoderma harzianum]|nr:hypothetical protein CI102_14849 [Trichoderma harzianum]
MGQAKLFCSNILCQVRSLLLVAVICLPAPPPTHDVITHSAWNNNGHGGTPYWQVLGWHVYPTRIFNHLNGGGTPNDVPSSHGLANARPLPSFDC